ncbi:MAG: TIGR00153 family protein [Phycisphaeraceae bacterium]
MRTIAKLFGRSPFGPLQTHMERVAQCVAKVPELFAALQRQDQAALATLAVEISQLEHAADQVKNDIRNNLPKRMFLPVDRSALLDMLSTQDSIADRCEDIGILLSLRQMDMIEALRGPFALFLERNVEAFQMAHRLIRELDELVESSFGGAEADKVKNMVEDVARKEHEVDLVQRELIKTLFSHEDQMTYGQFHLWNQVFQTTAALSNLSERLAFQLRMTVELK